MEERGKGRGRWAETTVRAPAEWLFRDQQSDRRQRNRAHLSPESPPPGIFSTSFVMAGRMLCNTGIALIDVVDDGGSHGRDQ